MTDNKLKFLGIDPPNDPEVLVLSVPLEQTVSYGKGTSKGPEAIIKATYQVELYDEELELERQNYKIDLLEAVKCTGRGIEEILNEVESTTKKIVEMGKMPFMLGGEHSITPAAIKGVLSKHKDITIVQLDAHADLREDYEGSIYSHASAIARVRELTNSVVQVGIRSLCIEEADLIKKENLPVFFAHQIHNNKNWIEDAIAHIQTEKIYITVDVDVFDSGILSETGTPEPGGLLWYDVLSFLRMLSIKKEIVGMDVVELAPVEGRISADFMIAKLVCKMVGYWHASKS